jgi:uncharacterized membrane protein YjgN (DUF898 family)
MTIDGSMTPLGANEIGTGSDNQATLRLAYRGTGGELFFIVIKNVFLTLITLGFYTPWARTAKRAFLWRQMEIGEHRLEYTGTGMELFWGYLKVGLVYLLLLGIPGGLQRAAPTVSIVWRLVGTLILVFIIPFAIYWSRRYLLGRTRWRGIRFGLAGEAKDFVKLFLWTSLLSGLTLGFYGPVANNRMYGFIMNNTRYGSAAFRYDGPNGEAFKIGIKGFFLTLLTLGIYLPWYLASMQRFRLAHTHFGGATGRTDITGGTLFMIGLVSVFGNALTLGLAFPWTTTYALTNIVNRMSFVGPIDFAQITQQAASGDAAGDMLAGALGVELGV